jgi:two-component system CheB/CheR fusion protein
MSPNDDHSEGDSGALNRPARTVPIIGIGASAGGIQALQEFFEALPNQVAATFVVVVHLDPKSQSDLARILAGRTHLSVTQVEGTSSLESDHVYVIPPDRQLQITDDEISAVEFEVPRWRRAPIDSFFRSLAGQHGESYAIILTGAGSDGAAGVKAVKEAGGIILIQDPREAEFPSMPKSAIATGVADFVLPVRDIARCLVELLRNRHRAATVPQGLVDDGLLQRVLAHVCSRTGHDFSKYKRATVLRRIARRMQVTKKADLQEYYDHLRDSSEEAQHLMGDLLISVTTFFRDEEAFKALAVQVVGHVFSGKDMGSAVRVWVPGCATGEEAYSIGILLLEEAARHEIRPTIQVFGSDLDSGAIATA